MADFSEVTKAIRVKWQVPVLHSVARPHIYCLHILDTHAGCTLAGEHKQRVGGT